MSRPPFDVPKPDVDEKGAKGSSAERLFMQLQALGGCVDAGALVEDLKGARMEAVLYQDLGDPRGVALLTWDRNPDHFIDRVQPLLRAGAFESLRVKEELTMFGRSYALGHEADLNEWLFERNRRTALDPSHRWAVWYPLRRSGRFMGLDETEQRQILMEHAKIGMSFAAGDYAHDIRLACHGLDRNDNDFVIGLTGKELAPLSKIVERMRRTVQTSQYLDRLGPFFVGRVIWQSAM